MTVACCWLDESYGRRRVTAIADARAAVKDKWGNWTPLNEVTTKLYRARVTCYQMSGLDTQSGTWAGPYFATELGIGFGGYCFEAMTIVALYQRCVEQLVVDGTHQPRPEPSMLALMLTEITSRWFRGHRSADRQEVEFLLFGFSPMDGEPWAAKIVRNIGKDAQLAEFSHPLEQQSVYSIGDVGQTPKFESAVAKVRQRIQKHAKYIRTGQDAEERDAAALEIARHISAEKKSIEQLVLDEMSNEFNSTVGGVLQKIEVVDCGNGRGVVAFSRNDQGNILDGLPECGDRLGYVPMSERMGWP